MSVRAWEFAAVCEQAVTVNHAAVSGFFSQDGGLFFASYSACCRAERQPSEMKSKLFSAKCDELARILQEREVNRDEARQWS